MNPFVEIPAIELETEYQTLRDAGIPVPKVAHETYSMTMTLPAGSRPFDGTNYLGEATLVQARGILDSMTLHNVRVDHPLQFEIARDGSVKVVLPEGANFIYGKKAAGLNPGLESAGKFWDQVRSTLVNRGVVPNSTNWFPAPSRAVSIVERVVGVLGTAERAYLDQQVMSGDSPTAALEQLGRSMTPEQKRAIDAEWTGAEAGWPGMLRRSPGSASRA